MNMQSITGFYLGNRDRKFQQFIIKLLEKANATKEELEYLTSKENMEEYGASFTSDLVDEKNYQVYEQLGDGIGAKFIVSYMYKRFPQLNCSEGVKVVARLKINYGSKETFSSFAETLGFWEYISATLETRNKQTKSLLEDVFEAFLGVTEYLLDKQKFGSGYIFVCSFLKSVFDAVDISLEYEDLYDAKTRLKELFDMCGEKVGKLVYRDEKGDQSKSNVYIDDGKGLKLIGTGISSSKPEAEQLASKKAIEYMKEKGVVKHAPSIYAQFSQDIEKESTTKEDILKFCKTPERINGQFFTRGKAKYRPKYTSTTLSYYCRKRDYEGIKYCLKAGANPNEIDSEGCTCVDLVLIGAARTKLIRKCLIKFYASVKTELLVHRNVFEIYLSRYKKLDLEDFNFKVIDEYKGVPIESGN